MASNERIEEQQQLDRDLWIIGIITAVAFAVFVGFGAQITRYSTATDHPALLRLLLVAILHCRSWSNHCSYPAEVELEALRIGLGK